jgi:hypothetical protein
MELSQIPFEKTPQQLIHYSLAKLAVVRLHCQKKTKKTKLFNFLTFLLQI